MATLGDSIMRWINFATDYCRLDTYMPTAIVDLRAHSIDQAEAAIVNIDLWAFIYRPRRRRFRTRCEGLPDDPARPWYKANLSIEEAAERWMEVRKYIVALVAQVRVRQVINSIRGVSPSQGSGSGPISPSQCPIHPSQSPTPPPSSVPPPVSIVLPRGFVPFHRPPGM